MANAATLLHLPYGNTETPLSGALFQPLLPWKFRYRHGRDARHPWTNTIDSIPMSSYEVAQTLINRYGQDVIHDDVYAWEDAARRWIRVSGIMHSFGYVRVSHEKSAESGISFEIQIENLLRYWQQNVLTKYPDSRLGPIFCDSAISARSTPFRSRRGGRAMTKALEPGDHVLVYAIDRGFRLVLDASQTWEREWKPRNIVPHFLNANIDLSTSDGHFMFAVLAAVSQRMSDELSDRMRQVAARLRKRGMTCNGRAGYGWKWQKYQRRKPGTNEKEEAKRRIPDMAGRAIMHEIARLRHVEGLSWEKISVQISQKMAEYDGEEFKQSEWFARTWSAQQCQTACSAWHHLIEDGFQKPLCGEECCRKGVRDEIIPRPWRRK